MRLGFIAAELSGGQRLLTAPRHELVLCTQDALLDGLARAHRPRGLQQCIDQAAQSQ